MTKLIYLLALIAYCLAHYGLSQLWFRRLSPDQRRAALQREQSPRREKTIRAVFLTWVGALFLSTIAFPIGYLFGLPSEFVAFGFRCELLLTTLVIGFLAPITLGIWLFPATMDRG